jgi:hypothetical protein
MMCPDIRGRFFHEEVPPIDARIASIQIAQGTEPRSTLGNDHAGGHRHSEVNNGLCVETGHCSAALMLDVQHEVPNVLVQDTPFLLEQSVPVRAVRDNLYSISF